MITPVCTIVALYGTHPRFPLVVAANRDELYARGAVGAGVLMESPRVVGGRDLAKGGTWMGVTRGGLFVGVTNQRTYGARDDALSSRGQLVLDALAAGSVDEVRRYLSAIDARDYNAFNLLFGDARGLCVAYARRDAREVAIEALARGTWILANDRIGSPEFPKAARAAELAEGVARGDDLASSARRMLSDHALPPIDRVPVPPEGAPFTRDFLQQLQAICIHTPVYGTRSSSVVAIGDAGVERYLFADGAPCVTDYADVTRLFADAAPMRS